MGHDASTHPFEDRDGESGQSDGRDTCDLSGTWAVQRVAFASVDSALVSGPQKSTRWYYLEVDQEDDAVMIVRGMWCGDITTGDATVRYSEGTRHALQPLANTGGRRGTYARTQGGCELSLERVYWVYGLQPRDAYLEGLSAPPGRIEGDPALTDLRPLPRATNDDVIDVDGDAHPGARSLIVDTPVGSGVRHGLQRGWEEMAGTTARGAIDFRIGVQYDFEEVVLEAMPDAFKTNAFVRKGAPHEARFVRLGRDFAGDDDDVCEAVRARLPHRPQPRDAF